MRFVPIMRPDAPSICIAAQEGEYVFQCLDIDNEVQVETIHATLPDALQQAVNTMRANGARYVIAS